MIIMILGELCNFAAYAFVEAIIVVCIEERVLLRIIRLIDSIDTHGRPLSGHLIPAIPFPA